MTTQPRDDTPTTQRDLLSTALSAAVPLRILELDRMGEWRRDRTIRSWAAFAANAVAYHGDTLLFPTKSWRVKDDAGKPTGIVVSTANTFNRLAAGVAALAYCPGGVYLFGLLFCARHERSGRASSPVCERCLTDPPTPPLAVTRVRRLMAPDPAVLPQALTKIGA